MQVLGLTGILILILLIDMSALLKKNSQRKKMLVIYTLILLSAYTIGVLQVLDKAPTSPSIIIEKIMKLFLG